MPLASFPAAAFAQRDDVCVVARVVDGDTLTCRGGERVRLLLVDAPEQGQGPFGDAARAYLAAILPRGTEARLVRDVEERDRYGRLLAYVYLPDGRMINRMLARQGFVVPLVYPPNVRHVELIRAAADSARIGGFGLWAVPAFSCRPEDFRQRLCRPDGAPAAAAPGAPSRSASTGCDPAYPDVCIPPPPPDLDCGDIRPRRFRVLVPDPHRFDGGGDGIGCERG